MRQRLTLHKVGDAICNRLTDDYSDQGVTNGSLKLFDKDLQKHHKERDSRERAADLIEKNENHGVFGTLTRSIGITTIDIGRLQYCEFLGT